MRSARITGPGVPLEISESADPVPAGGQVLVRVKSAGVCHSDLHLWEGGYDLGDGQFMKVTDRGVRYPVTPGHEIAGTVEAAGPDAAGVAPGDGVLVFPWVGCRGCPACAAGTENLCDSPQSIGIFRDGGYADRVLVPDAGYLARLDGVDPDAATSLACSGLTAYNALKKAYRDSPEHVIIIGAGGLGLMGVQAAKALGGATITCVDLDDEKLATARQMGADHAVNSGSGDAAGRIMEICGGLGAGSVVDFVNAPATAKLGLSVLRKRGRLVLVGLFGGSVDLPLVTVPLKSITIEGAYTGSYGDMVELLALARAGTIRPVITKRYPLDGANSALEDLKARKIIGRAVINP